MSDTPRTDKAVKESSGQWSFELRMLCIKLETELAAVKAERDALAEALDEVLEDYVFGGCIANSTMRKAEQALDSVKGGSDE